MNPTAQAALDRARQPTPAPVFSTDTARPNKPITLPAITGPINHFMRLQAREEARDLVLSMRATLAWPNGLAQVITRLKLAAVGRPDSHVAGYLDIIEWLEAHDK